MSGVDLLLRLPPRGLAVSANGDRLRITGPTAVLTPGLRAELSAAKPELLAWLNTNQGSAGDRIRVLPAGEPAPLSFTQQRFWFFHSLVPDTSAYHVCFGLRLQGVIDSALVPRSVDEIVRRHAVLRSVFTAIDGQPTQRAMPVASLPLAAIDL